MDTSRFAYDGVTAVLHTSKGVLKMDAEDVSLCERGMLKFKQMSNGCYADLWTTTKKRRRIGSLARIIMNAPSDLQVDHMNHDTLDNRRCNLRLCTRSENMRNGRKQKQSKARFKGVIYHTHGGYDGSRSGGVMRRWRAYTRVMGKRVWLGYYATDVEAAMAYNRFAAKEFREFACYNRFDECPALKLMQEACQHDA